MFQEAFPLTDKTCFLYGNPQPSHLLIQPVGAQDLSGGLEKEVACLKRGIVSSGGSCRKFKYDPLKRKPPMPAVLDTSVYEQKDFEL